MMRKHRWLAGILAFVVAMAAILSVTPPLVIHASATARQKSQLWRGSDVTVLGHWRPTLYRWYNSDNGKDLFCINQGKYMLVDTVLEEQGCSVGDFVPLVDSTEQFQCLAGICDWYEKGAHNDLRYAVAQFAVWAAMEGYCNNMAEADSDMKVIAGHIKGDYLDQWEKLKAFLKVGNALPSWCAAAEAKAPCQKMTLEDGSYRLRLDMGSCPQLSGIKWSFPGTGWSKQTEGNSLLFTYCGGEMPAGILVGDISSCADLSWKNDSSFRLYSTKDPTFQLMINGGGNTDRIYVRVGGALNQNSVIRYRHRETFEANYRIELNKYCAETGQQLQDAVFEVEEYFDNSQLKNLRKEDMYPYIHGAVNCRKVTSDGNGWAVHQDKRFYDYDRTYCMGHPEPDYTEVPEAEMDEDTGEVTNQTEISSAEEENDRLRQLYEDQIAACEDTTDFHDIDGGGRDRMLDNRNELYSQFVSLEYIYQIKEIQARNGYILHGVHPEDERVKAVGVTSSEGGARASEADWETGMEMPRQKEGGQASESQNCLPSERLNGDKRIFGLPVEFNPDYENSEIEFTAGEREALDDIRMIEKVDFREQMEMGESGRYKDSKERNKAEEAELGEAKSEEVGAEVYDENRSSEEDGDLKTADLTEGMRETAIEEGRVQTGQRNEENNTERAGTKDPDNQGNSDDLYSQEKYNDGFSGTVKSQELSSSSNTLSSPKNQNLDKEDTPIFPEAGLQLIYTVLPYRQAPYLLGGSRFRQSSHRKENAINLLPPEEDNLPWIDPGNPDQTSYIFKVWDHRTEGEVHINKRDRDLYFSAPEDSYGKTQGDAILEGAVYGLFAAADICHPDGKTGIVFRADDLVSTAATDENGDASFLVITEQSPTALSAHNLDGSWVGHPLLLGSYYVKELSRSEGYELSVSGKDLPFTNRTASEQKTGTSGMKAEVTVPFRHPVENYDGSWNEFQVKSQGITDGYDIWIKGYPSGSSFYRVEQQTELKLIKEIAGMKQQQKTDQLGNPVFRIAEGGERKLDKNGSEQIAVDPETGEVLYDNGRPVAESFVYSVRSTYYPSGSAMIDGYAEMEKADRQLSTGSNSVKSSGKKDISDTYIKDQTNSILKQLGYHLITQDDGNGAPWLNIELFDKGQGLDSQAVIQITDWYAANHFFDCGGVESIFEKDGKVCARIFYDYSGIGKNAVVDGREGHLYVKKAMIVAGGNKNSHYWLKYESGTFRINGGVVTVDQRRELSPDSTVIWGEHYEKDIHTVYEPLYETYATGEILLDLEGKPVQELETVPIYHTVTCEETKDVLIPLTAVQQADNTWKIHVDGSSGDETEKTVRYRASTPHRTIEVSGEEMMYGDFLTQIAGAAVSVSLTAMPFDPGSYIEYVTLLYPGQNVPFQDENTRKHPVVVLERIIRQSVHVTKDVAQESYDAVNTYRLHRDPFTVLFGGYGGGLGAKTIKGFCFRLYLKKDLVNTGQLKEKQDGSGYDYERLFAEFPDYGKSLAVIWDEREMDVDGDLTTVHAIKGSGVDDYFGDSIPLPYGTYVLVEQQSDEIPGKHYETDLPQEISLPFVPDMDAYGIHEEWPSRDYIYYADWTPDQLTDKFKIRFCEESDIISGHNRDGDFDVFPYGTGPSRRMNCGNSKVEQYYHYGRSEKKGEENQVFYDRYVDDEGNITDYGITLDHVPSMIGSGKAVDRKYSAALVPWSLAKPESNPSIKYYDSNGAWLPGRESEDRKENQFQFQAYANADMENRFYSCRIRVEKVDAETKEPLLQEEALFKIYAAKRDVLGGGPYGVTGTGSVIYKTEEVMGSRNELEKQGDVDGIHWDEERRTYTGVKTVPDYDHLEQIFMEDEEGRDVGIFKAFSTAKEVVTEEGEAEKIPVGYLTTYKPLGAGVYVLVEVKAPPGYQISRPVAFEVYSDQVQYDSQGRAEQRAKALQYQYEIPVTGEGDKYGKETVSQLIVEDIPSRIRICKVEDGDDKVGDRNGLDDLTGVNDKGDILPYEIWGRKEYLEAREDVEHICWDQARKLYWGTAVKTFDEYSETIIEGQEEILRSMEGVKPLYGMNSDFSGRGIRFDVPIQNAGLCLYKGIALTKGSDGKWAGIKVKRNGSGRVVEVTAEMTGSHLELRPEDAGLEKTGKDVWNTVSVSNELEHLVFYQLDITPTERDEATGEVYVLDDKGNRICMADVATGMAYAKDDYGRAAAYCADQYGNKRVALSPEITETDASPHLYRKLEAVTDEQGLPIYYKNPELTYTEESWTTAEDGIHKISRLPFGAYILEETSAPNGDGYVKAPAVTMIFQESAEEQTFYYQDEFTKINVAKIDIDTKKEIQDAELTLYHLDKTQDGYAPSESKEAYVSWTSGYACDDKGNVLLEEDGTRKKTARPHWLDHIPPGSYLMEETKVPYEWGYTRGNSQEISVLETGAVQTFVMENDYTAVEIKKCDLKTGEVMDSSHSAELTLYKACLDSQGSPALYNGPDGTGEVCPVWREEDRIVSWMTEDGKAVAATAMTVTDEYGETKTSYAYKKKKIPEQPGMRQAVYYTVETGAVRFDYLPVGYYVLAETDTPKGYATSDPVLFEVRDVGSREEIQSVIMEDAPIQVDIAKLWKAEPEESEGTGIGMVSGAQLELYDVYPDGSRGAEARYSWTSGNDGEGQPHRIEYIPAGEYVLVEKETPYGFLKAADLYFSLEDTPKIQTVVMKDMIPQGKLIISKRDAEDETILLEGAVFELNCVSNHNLKKTLTTGSDGQASLSGLPIGITDTQGNFQSYIYTLTERISPEGYHINSIPFEFQFQYGGNQQPCIVFCYDASNRKNQLRVTKINRGSGLPLAGARLVLVDKHTEKLTDQWITTEQPHYVDGIPAGDYILKELETPGPGYAKAPDMEIVVTDEMDGVLNVIMEDDVTKIGISKVDENGRSLPGARLRLEHENGEVVEEWTSERAPQLFYGLIPGLYRVVETEPPNGYEKGEIVKIEVQDSYLLQLFYYRNKKVTKGNEEDEKIPPLDETETNGRVGTITASYEPPKISGKQILYTDEIKNLGKTGGVRTGDDTPLMQSIAVLFLSIIGALFMKRHSKKGL